MICPQTNKPCRAFECLHLKGVCRLLPPPKPTMAEIERLVDQFETAATSLDRIGDNEIYRLRAESQRHAARAALLAAIRALSNSTQDSE